MLLAIKKVIIGLIAYIAITVTIILVEAAIISEKVPVSLPSMSIVNVGNSVVAAKGTWAKSSGESLGNVLQTSDISCSKERMECIVADASINQFYGSSLDVNVERYRIIEWTDSKVSYVNDSPLCVYYYYSIDRVAESATGVRFKRSPKEISGNPDCERLEDELKVVLRNGFDIWQEERKKAAVPALEVVISALLFWRNLF